MRTWAVANQKGGVGKTTTSVSLGGLLAHQGRETLLVDLDPHGSMTAYFGIDPDSVSPSVYDLFDAGDGASGSVSLLRETSVPGLMLLPASTAIATLDRQLGSRSGMGLVVRRALEAVSRRFEFTLIDCPPMLGVLMVNALAACDELLIPVQTEYLALKGLERMLVTLDMIERSRSQRLSYRIVPTLFDRRTRASIGSLRELRFRYPDCLWGGAIPVDTQFRDASRKGVPLTSSHPWTRGSLAYRKLLETLLSDGVPQLKAANHE